jgi:cytidine deaminase
MSAGDDGGDGGELQGAGGPAAAADSELYTRALAAAARAYAPYSGFAVGATVVDEDGAVFDGVNVENACYPAGQCAERVALGAFATAGGRRLAAVAVASPGANCVPCGACLQALAEFGDPRVVCRQEGELRVWRLSELLRLPFTLEKAHP